VADRDPGESPSAAFTGALANEQFILQSVSGATISESASRAALYLSSLSSGLVAIGFASASRVALTALAFSVLPTVFLLGCFTVVRLIDTSVANLVALRRIERIRAYWAALDPLGPRFFEPDNHEAGHRGVHYGFWASLFTMASLVIVVNSVLAGAVIALFCSLAVHLPPAIDVAAGLMAGGAAVLLGLIYQRRRLDRLIRGAATSPGPERSTGS
jgi:hypothetical protein